MANSEELIPESTTETSAEDSLPSSSYDTLMQVSNEIFTNPLNLILLSISAFLLYKILGGRKAPRPRPEPEVELPQMKKKDMALDELKQFNGTNEDGRICIAVNGRIYDVTRGKQFYGPGGPYSIFAGRDASRALALFTVSESALKTEDDDLSDLTSAEMNRMREWQIQLEEKYDFVGRLLKPGQEPVDYTDSEEENANEEEVVGDEKEKINKEEIEEIKEEPKKEIVEEGELKHQEKEVEKPKEEKLEEEIMSTTEKTEL